MQCCPRYRTGHCIFALFDLRGAPLALLSLAALLVTAAFYRPRLVLPLGFSLIALVSILLQCPRTPATTEGRLMGQVSLIKNSADRKSITLSHAILENETLHGKVELYFEEPIALPEIGDTVILSCRLYNYKNVTTLRTYGLAARGAGQADTMEITKATRATAATLLARLRSSIATRIGLLFPEEPALAQGMLLGSAGVEETDNASLQLFRDMGLAHVLAVSGLRLGIIAGAIMMLLRPIRNGWLRFFLLLLFLLFYAALTSFTPSVMRASIMMLCAAPAMDLRRRYDGLSALSLAFLLILLVSPFSLWRAGFQLSFLAVGGILLLVPVFQKLLFFLPEKLTSALAVDFAVVIATLPATARFFGVIPLSSLLANLIILPLVPFFIVPALVCTLLSYLWMPLAQIIALFPRFVLNGIVWIARHGAIYSITLPAPGTITFLLYLSALVFFSQYCLLNKRVKLPFASGLLVFSLFLWFLGA